MIVEILSTLEHNDETNGCAGFIFLQEITLYENKNTPESERKKIILTTPKFGQYCMSSLIGLLKQMSREASVAVNPNSIVTFQIVADNNSNDRRNFYIFNSVDYINNLHRVFSMVNSTKEKHCLLHVDTITLSPKNKHRPRIHNQTNVFNNTQIKLATNSYSLLRANNQYVFVIDTFEKYSGSSYTQRRFNTIIFNTLQEYETFLLYLFTFLETGKFDFVCDDKLNSSEKVRIPYYDLFLVCHFLKFVKTTPINMKQELIIISN